MIDPKASPQDFMNYLQDLQKTGKKDGDVEAILKSQTLIQGVNMQQAIKGFQDLGQVGEWAQKNEKLLKQVDALAGNRETSNQKNPTPSSAVTTEPNNTLTGKLVKDGVTGGHVTGIVGDSTK